MKHVTFKLREDIKENLENLENLEKIEIVRTIEGFDEAFQKDCAAQWDDSSEFILVSINHCPITITKNAIERVEIDDAAERLRFRVKGREREAALIRALPGFMQILQSSCAKQVRVEGDLLEYYGIASTPDVSPWAWEINFGADEIEDSGVEYDPTKWNRWPDAKPPSESEDYRVGYRLYREGLGGEGADRDMTYSIGRFVSGSWFIDGEGDDELEAEHIAELIFRPFLSPGDSEEVNE